MAGTVGIDDGRRERIAMKRTNGGAVRPSGFAPPGAGFGDSSAVSAFRRHQRQFTPGSTAVDTVRSHWADPVLRAIDGAAGA
jgi:hypothetical protein